MLARGFVCLIEKSTLFEDKDECTPFSLSSILRSCREAHPFYGRGCVCVCPTLLPRDLEVDMQGAEVPTSLPLPTQLSDVWQGYR